MVYHYISKKEKSMNQLKLNFDAVISGEPRSYIVEVPYNEGIVATSEFCPTELLSGRIDLMAAIRGESLDKFMEHCKLQLIAMSKINEADTELDRHIGGLMAVVMDHISRKKTINYGDLLIYIDCFSLLLKAADFDSNEIREIYPHVAKTIINLYTDNIENCNL